MLPATRSPRWVLAFVLLALQLAGAFIALGASRNDGELPPTDTLLSIVGVNAAIAAVLSLIGFFGGRATFVCAVLGMLAGLAYMAWVYASSDQGMADLGALMMFFMLGGLGLVIGAIVDITRAVRARR